MTTLKTVTLLCFMLFLTACATTADMSKTPLALPNTTANKANIDSLLSFISKAKIGERMIVHDSEKDNEEGTAIIVHSYYAASGNQCRAYYWVPFDRQEKASAHNLKVACKASSGEWHKLRTLSNIEAFVEKRPVGYALH